MLFVSTKKVQKVSVFGPNNINCELVVLVSKNTEIIISVIGFAQHNPGSIAVDDEKRIELFDAIYHGHLLHQQQWSFFKAVFAVSESQVEEINAAFVGAGIVQNTVLQSVVLGICRLMDPASTTRRKLTLENLSFANLLETVDNKDVYEVLLNLHKDLLQLCEPLLYARNKRFAHSDKVVFFGESDLGFGYALVDRCLVKMSQFLQVFANEYQPNLWIEEEPIAGSIGFLTAMRKSNDYDALHDAGHISSARALGAIRAPEQRRAHLVRDCRFPDCAYPFHHEMTSDD